MLKVYIKKLDDGKIIMDSEKVTGFVGVTNTEEAIESLHYLDRVSAIKYIKMLVKLKGMIERGSEGIGLSKEKLQALMRIVQDVEQLLGDEEAEG